MHSRKSGTLPVAFESFYFVPNSQRSYISQCTQDFQSEFDQTRTKKSPSIIAFNPECADLEWKEKKSVLRKQEMATLIISYRNPHIL